MSECDLCEKHLDRRLDVAEQAAFDKHLSDCSACTAEVEFWQETSSRVVAWQNSIVPIFNDTSRARLTAASKRRRHSWLWPTTIALAASAAVLLMLPSVQTRQRTKLTRTEVVPKPKPKPKLHAFLIDNSGKHSTQPADGLGSEGDDQRRLFALGVHRVGLDEGSKAELLVANSNHIRVRVVHGRTAFSVQARRNISFIIEIGSFEVRVTGTKLMVERDTNKQMWVSVSEGEVRVSGGGMTAQMVAAGQRLLLGQTTRMEKLSVAGQEQIDALLQADRPAAASPTPRAHPASEAPPPRISYQVWRRRIVSGQPAGVAREIERHLLRNDSDWQAWSLLADARRKLRLHEPAVLAYQRVIDGASAQEANRARYLAATILQDEIHNPQRAQLLLRAYLNAGENVQPLAAAVSVRLGKALLAQNKGQQARTLFESILRRYPGTNGALEAKAYLKRWPE